MFKLGRASSGFASLRGGRFRWFWLRGNKRRPGLSGLGRVIALRQLRGRGRNHNEVMAGRTLNLFSAHALVALQVLIALRAGKLELAHGRTLARMRGMDNTLLCIWHQCCQRANAMRKCPRPMELANPFTPSASSPGDNSILTAFTGEIKPTRVSLFYKIGLAVVAFAMILLPAVYLAVIALAIWLIYLHVVYNTWILTGGGLIILKIIGYGGPVLAGCILVFFMIKPFFAKRPHANAPFSLRREDEPVLFEFIDRICRLVRAPVPSRVDVDMQVNASASLQRGVMSNDLVLTIGLPLVAGLNTRELGGVLAHEFGHFAQGAGIRLTYIVRHINLWFARVVYERDEWDIKLERGARDNDLRLVVILQAARFCVWLTRRVLWALMHVGTTISCFMLRQMEFDADSYEAKFSGSDAFETTASQLRKLNVASHVAYEDMRQSWASKRLPENLPLLVQHKASTLPADVRDKLREAADKQKTGWFDTHPSDGARIRAARRLDEPGVFRSELPATVLFTDFKELSRRLTRHHLEKDLRLDIGEANFVNADEMLRESEENARNDAAVRKFYSGVSVAHVPLFAGPPPLTGLQDLSALRSAWQRACETAAHYQSAAAEWSAFSDDHEKKLIDCTAANHLLEAGFTLTIGSFGLPESADSVGEQIDAVRKRLAEINTALAESSVELKHFVGATCERVIADLESLRLPEVYEAVSKVADFRAEADRLLKVYAVLGTVMPLLRKMGRKLRAFLVLIQNRANHGSPDKVDSEIDKVARELRESLAQIQSNLQGLQYPFPHARGEISLVEYARHGKREDSEWKTVFEESNTHLERLFSLHYRVLGRLLVIADQVEKNWPAGTVQGMAV